MAAARKGKSSKATAQPVVAVIGYGSQGRAVARNLRDSGYGVVVGLRSNSSSRSRVKNDGLPKAVTLPVAVRRADIVCLAFPDHLHGRVFRRSIRPYLRRGQTLWLLHSTSVHFGLIEPPAGVDVLLVAPHAPGEDVRRAYETDSSLSAFYAVQRNESGRAGRLARALATAIGIRRENLLKTTFRKEAIGDLFGEQAVLCGGLAMLIKSGFETLTAHGWSAEQAYLEVAHQLDLIVGLVKRHGVRGMFERISPAARFGSVQAGPKVVPDQSRAGMEEVFRHIASGRFADELEQLSESDLRKLGRDLARLTNPALEKASRRFSK